jgi:IMP dehydrogenase/GMP reductase
LKFTIHHDDKPLKEKSYQQVNKIAQSIVRYLVYGQQQQLIPKELQKDVKEAVEQSPDLTKEKEVTPEQVIDAVGQVLEQLPKENAQPIQEALQNLPKQQIVPQTLNQVIKQVQQVEIQVAQKQPQQQQQIVPQQSQKKKQMSTTK